MKKRMLSMVVSLVLLLCSCGTTNVIVLKEPQKANTVALSLYVMNITKENAGEFAGIHSVDLDESVRAVEECITIMKSAKVITRVMLEIDPQEMVITMSDLRSMLSIEPVEETAVVRVEFSSKDYTEEQLLKIAQAFASVVPNYINQEMSGNVHVSLVDSPSIVE